MIASWICQIASLFPDEENFVPGELRALLLDCCNNRGYLNLHFLSSIGTQQFKDDGILDALDQIGRLAKVFSGPRLEKESLTSLYGAWQQNRSRFGILSICVHLLLSGIDAELPTSSFVWSDFCGKPEEKAMTLLKIQNGEILDADLSYVVGRIEQLLTEKEGAAGIPWRHHLSMAIERSTCERRILEKLVTELHRLVSPNSSRESALTISLMDDLVGKRRSGLGDPKVSARLNLPINPTT